MGSAASRPAAGAAAAFSLGIADAVTICAKTAAHADAAATVVANAVDLPNHPAIHRAPADSIQAESDLGDRLVTRYVGKLTNADIEEALGRGWAVAKRLVAAGSITAASLHCQGTTRFCVDDGLPERSPSYGIAAA